MGCCASAPKDKEVEIEYGTVELVKDVDFENSQDPAGERLVEGLKDFLMRSSKFHNDIAFDITYGFLQHYGNGEIASARKIWGEGDFDNSDW